MRRCLIWSTTDITWNSCDWLWSKCKDIPEPTAVIQQGGVDASLLVQPWQQEETYNPYRSEIERIKSKKNKKLIKLMCKIRGEEYKEEKEMKAMDFGVNDITLKKVEKMINLNLKLEE